MPVFAAISRTRSAISPLIVALWMAFEESAVKLAKKLVRLVDRICCW